MSVKTITGDLIKSAKKGEFELIAHQANCFNTMGSGIALAIKKEWPEAADVDNETIKGDRTKLGTISFTKNTNPIIVNLYGQFDFWSPGVLTDYVALEKALLETKKTFPGKKIGMPKIGSLRARGDWNTIYAIIQKVFCDDSDDVTIVEWEQDDSKATSSSVAASLSALSAFNNPVQSSQTSSSDDTDSTVQNVVAALPIKKKFHGKRKCKVCNTYHPIRKLINYLPSVWVCKQNCNQKLIDKVVFENELQLLSSVTSQTPVAVDVD